jgi:radical SAM protein with 4Fe4S-binding SPASM domain
VGGRFEKVYQNMVEMVRIAREEKSKIELMWQFIALSNNEHEIEDARKMAKQIGIPIYIKTFAESIPGLSPKNPEYRRGLQDKPCTDIYRAVYVYWNGDVVPCCYDVDGKEIMGNIAENTLEAIWNSEKYISFRKQVDEAVSHPEKESYLCWNCQRWTLPKK